MIAEIKLILEGEFDEHLSEFKNAIQQREKAIGKLSLDNLCPDDEVRFSDQIRPRYLIGRTATVVKINRTTVTVSCPDDPGYGRFQGNQQVRCPFSLIDGMA